MKFENFKTKKQGGKYDNIRNHIALSCYFGYNWWNFYWILL